MTDGRFGIAIIRSVGVGRWPSFIFGMVPISIGVRAPRKSGHRPDAKNSVGLPAGAGGGADGARMTHDEGLDQDLMVEVWRIASAITRDRPWLLASWSDNTPNIPHLVVHDGAHGAALHFDQEDGPYWSGGFTRRMTWADVTSADEPEEWAMGWGERATTRRMKGKVAAYAILSALSARWAVSKVSWVVRPAPILADSADSAFALAELFPTAAESVQHYRLFGL